MTESVSLLDWAGTIVFLMRLRLNWRHLRETERARERGRHFNVLVDI